MDLQGVGCADRSDGVRPRSLADLVDDLVTGRIAPRTHLQPIVNLHGPRIAGYEALARLDPMGRIGPDRVIAAAWDLGVGAELETLCALAALERRADLLGEHFLAINVSPVTLESRAFEAVVGLPSLQGLVIELTEHVPLHDLPDLPARLDLLRERGAIIAMDDAGAGYAGLAALLVVRPEIVKLDRGLVNGIDRDAARSRLASAFGAFLGELDAWLLAEGVETYGELEEIVRIGIPLAQGYLFGRPSPEPIDLDQVLRERLMHVHRPRSNDSCAGEYLEPAERIGALADAPPTGWWVLQPTGRKPLAVGCCWSNGERRQRWERPLVVHEEDPLDVLLQRALVRDDGALEPIVVVDADGAACGVVKPSRVVRCVLFGRR